MNQFHKVSYEQFMKSMPYDNRGEVYDNIKLPQRSTRRSAGYDFYSPITVTVKARGEQVVTIPSGIKCELDEDKYLAMHIRSSLGIKQHLSLPNCTGIIDADYYNNEDNEGQIYIALVNHGDEDYVVHAGDKVCQGIITSYYTTADDDADGDRNGGIGSTGTK